MNAQRARAAEELLAWPPLPEVPLRFRSAVAAAGQALADYVGGDTTARRRFAEALDQVVTHPRFAQAPRVFRVALAHRAGTAHNWCGVGESDDAELERAGAILADGLRSAVPGGAEEARLRYTLGNTLHNLFLRTTRTQLLDQATEQVRRAVDCAGADRLLAAQCRSGLASVLETRFRTAGDAQALTEALEHARLAVSTAGDTSLGHRFAYVLAELLSTRYDAYGDLDDLDAAIDALRGATGARDHIMAPRTGHAVHGRLGSLLRRKYLRTGDVTLIHEAVRMTADAVGSDVSRADPAALGNLGNALLTRYEALGDSEDLRGSVELHLRVVRVRGADDWQMASAHNNAGNSLAQGWHASGDDSLGDLAITHYRSALELTSDGAPEFASRAYNLGITLHARSASGNGDPDDLAEEAVAAYRAAVDHGLENALEWALAAARHWGRWAMERGSWEEACSAYAGGLRAAGRLFRNQLLRDAKEAWLAGSQGMPAEAAYALYRAGRPQEAVTTLEAGRGMLLSEALGADRSTLGHLAATGHADLVDRYRSATTALDEAMRGGADTAVLRGHRDALDELIDEIRAVNGQQGFLTTPGLDDVRRAVPPGAIIVYLAAASPGGAALTVDHDGRVTSIDLPALTTEAVHRRAGALLSARWRSADAVRNSGGSGRNGSAASWKGTLDAVTRWTWQAVVAPVLSVAGDAEDIVFVPSGTLAMLPLHAAWRPVPGAPGARHYLLDERTVRYAPNARALAFTRQVAAGTPVSRLMTVADPRPSSLQPIGYARAETAWARHWFPSSEVLAGAEASRAAVLAALPHAHVHHFVCHGRAESSRPLDSALVMAGDEELTLRDIFSLRMMRLGTGGAGSGIGAGTGASTGTGTGADTDTDTDRGTAIGGGVRLSVLSSCDTDRPGSALPDEVVSLPSGLIQAGVAGVVASQWAVRSEAVSLLLARFYQVWRSDGFPPAAALRAAQRWLRDTTNAEKAADLSVTLTPHAADDDLAHLVRALRLRDPNARPYRHPADWAALSFHGS